jgi:uncharacterized protein
LISPKYLLDVNVLIALTHEDHVHHSSSMKWFRTPGLDWGLCAFSEAGFLRVSINQKTGRLTLDEAAKILATLIKRVVYRFWPIAADWAVLAAPFVHRTFGHHQIADAYLLGLAVRENGILVTFDGAIRSMAGPKLSKHVLVLE